MEKQEASGSGPIVDLISDLKRDQTTEQSEERAMSNDVNSNEIASSEPTSEKDVEIIKTGDDDYEYITGFKLVLVASAVTMVAFLITLDASIVVTAIPRITSDFYSIPDIGWYGAAYLLSNCSPQPLTGKLYTHFSSKITFLSFLAVFELGSLLCGAAVSSKMLIVGRAVAGLGGSGLVNGALTIVSASVPLQKRPVLLGIIMGVAQMGTLFGPLIGGVLTQYTTWRWCFYINLPAGAATAVLLIAIRVPDRVVKSEAKSTIRATLDKLDLPGFVIFVSAIVMFLLALQWGGGDYSWSSSTIIGLFIGSFGFLCVFLAWEYRRGSTAMIPLSMFKYREVWSSCLTGIFLMGNLFVTTYYLPVWFQVVLDASPTLSGAYILPIIFWQILFAVVSGILVGRLGYYLPWVVSSGAFAAVGTGLMSTFTPRTTTGTWIGYQIIVGSGRGMGLQMPLVAIQNTLPADQVAIGTSLIVFCQYFGGALFVSFAQTIFTNGLVNALPTFAPELDAQTIISAGATSLRAVIPESSVPGTLLAYNQALNHTFYLAAGAAVAMFIACWGMGWKSVKKPKVETPEA